MIEFYREKLTDEETICYSLMLRGFQKYKFEVDCGAPAPESVAKAYLSLYDDHPELFFMSNAPKILQTQAGFAGFGAIRKSSKVAIDPIYSNEQINSCQRTIEQTIALLKSETSKLKTDEEKIVHVADYLVAHTDYEITIHIIRMQQLHFAMEEHSVAVFLKLLNSF